MNTILIKINCAPSHTHTHRHTQFIHVFFLIFHASKNQRIREKDKKERKYIEREREICIERRKDREIVRVNISDINICMDI